MTARASAVVITKTEAVGRTHGVIAAQVIHTRFFTFPGGHGWSGGGSGGGGQGHAEADPERRKEENLGVYVCVGCVRIKSDISIFFPLCFKKRQKVKWSAKYVGVHKETNSLN